MACVAGGAEFGRLRVAADLASAGRVYAAYGGVYVAVALLWLWKIDRVPLSVWDIVGASVSIAGMGIIVYGGWRA